MNKLLPLLLLFVLSSCARKIDFTQTLREELEASNVDLSAVQYYTNDGFTLNRVDGTGKEIAVDEMGVLEFGAMGTADALHVSSNTPGICLHQQNSHRIGISFEEGKYVFYESDSTEVAYGNRYKLRRDRDAYGQHIDTWDSYPHFEARFHGGEVWLQVKKRKVAKLLGNTRTLRGQRVYGNKVPRNQRKGPGFWDRFNNNKQNKSRGGGKSLPRF